MVWSPEVASLLACPACRQALTPQPGPQAAAWLVCARCQVDYPVIDGIPVLIVERAAPSQFLA